MLVSMTLTHFYKSERTDVTATANGATSNETALHTGRCVSGMTMLVLLPRWR